MDQRIGALERGTQLADVPAFDDGDAVLQGAALAHAGEQFARGELGVQRVFADLELARGVQLARKQLPLGVVAFIHAGIAQFAHDGLQAVARGDDHAGLVGADGGVGEAALAVPEPCAGGGQQQCAEQQ
ncbi:hypothetical protein D9M71_610980 [compost metagenome]